MDVSRRSTWMFAVATAGWVSTIGSAEHGLAAQSPRSAFRAGIELVSLNVTVSKGAQQYVDDLERDDFVVLENNVPQNVTFFGKTSVPLSLALLLDTSASMDQALTTAQEAAVGFARTLGPADLATVLDFDTRVQTAQGFTGDVRALEEAIRGTAAGGSTALYNAIYIALKEMNKLKPQDAPRASRRRAIIVLSDGDDTSSLVDFDEVIDVASRSDTVIYAIGLGPRPAPGSFNKQDGQFVLRRLAQQTGGRAFFPQEAKDLASVYRDIREELSSQYSLAYESASPMRDGHWRQIAVRVNRPSVTVRTRQGYFAPSK